MKVLNEEVGESLIADCVMIICFLIFMYTYLHPIIQVAYIVFYDFCLSSTVGNKIIRHLEKEMNDDLIYNTLKETSQILTYFSR